MVDKIYNSRRIVLLLNVGLNDKGEPLYSRKAVRNIAFDATLEEIHECAHAVAALYSLSLERIYLDEDFILA